MGLDDLLGLSILAGAGWYVFLRKPLDLSGIARLLGKTATELQQAYEEGASGSSAPAKSGEELLLNVAERLRIDSQGKTLAQVAEEIVKKST